MFDSELNNKNLLRNQHKKLTFNYDTIHNFENLKRNKSHEVYEISKKKQQQIKPITENSKTPSNNGNRIFNKLQTLNLCSSSNFNKPNGFVYFKSNNISKTPIKSGKKMNLIVHSEKIVSKKTSKLMIKPKNIDNIPVVSKILNDGSKPEFETEENITNLEENDQGLVNKLKSSALVSNFYTCSIGESSSNIDKDKKLINNIPKPFVKPFKTKFIDINLDIDMINDIHIDDFPKNNKKNPNQSPLKKSSKKNNKKELTIKASKLKENKNSKFETICKEKELIIPKVELGDDKTTLDTTRRKSLIAAKKGDRDTFLECLEIIFSSSNGDINFKDENGWTALHYACDEGNLKIVDILINTNADVNCRTNNKKTPLHLATSHGYFDISKNIVENGGIINSLDDEKNTPIHICSSIGHFELLKYLLDRFPQADAKNINGKTPIDLAKKDEIKALLQEYLKKNESHYQKVQIHTTNNKTANTLFKNFNNSRKVKTNNNTNEHIINNYINYKAYNTNNQPLKSQKNILNKFNFENFNNTHHNKYQSNDFNNKAYLNNNIEIQINTNINHPGGGNINVVNVKDTPPTKKNIKINDKVQVTVEAKLDDNHFIESSNISNQSQVSKVLNETSTSVKLNTYMNKLSKNKSQSQSKLTGIVNKLQQKKQSSTISNCQLNKINPNTPRNINIKKYEAINLSYNIKQENIFPIKKDILRGECFTQKQTLEKIPLIDLTETEFSLNKFEEQGNSQSYSQFVINTTGTINKSNSNSDDNQINVYSMEEESIGPSSFLCHAILGKGSFGEVYLVEKRNTKTLYAMKVLSKDRIMGQNLVKYAMTERNVLSITSHPFIVKLNYSFQTSNKLFLILDYCPGGDLAEHLAREKRFSEQTAKIYLCEIILALEDLHKRDIIFRDLKPDNVVLDAQGHAQLTDFGLSREGVLDSKSAKSFCGSIAYLAPEMLKRTGHGKAVDWYLLGVLFYEMIVGIPPYFAIDKEQLFQNIENAELQIPKFISEDAASILAALLQRDPIQRLGSGENDANEIKQHKYFNDIDWEIVYERKLKPPIPDFESRAIRHFSKPRIFEDTNSTGLFFANSQFENLFDGWSFINSEDQNSINNTK